MQTLGDLQHTFKLYAVCIPCERMEPLSMSTLIHRFGAQTAVSRIRAHVRCRCCGEYRPDIRIVFTGPCNRLAGFHYNR